MPRHPWPPYDYVCLYAHTCRGAFLQALSDNGLGFARRYCGGPDIDAACGLLASRARGGVAHPPLAPVP